MNQLQAAQLTQLIKDYAQAYSEVDRTDGCPQAIKFVAADKFIAAQCKLADKISSLTEVAK
jgi:hypothetical protein